MRYFLIILCLAISTFGCGIQKQTQPRTQWEYLTVNIPDKNFDAQMNSYGHDGWELVFARRANTNVEITALGGEPGPSDFDYEVIFKRPVSQ